MYYNLFFIIRNFFYFFIFLAEKESKINFKSFYLRLKIKKKYQIEKEPNVKNWLYPKGMDFIG